MSVSVGVNNLSVVHAGSGGVTTVFPDMCKTPTPGGPVPMPYPNVAKSADADGTSKSVTCDGEPICLDGSYINVSVGDEAGSAGGVASNKTKGKAEFVNFSQDVKIEGKGVVRALDLATHNDTNTPPAPLLQGPVVAKAPEEVVCVFCEEKM